MKCLQKILNIFIILSTLSSCFASLTGNYYVNPGEIDIARLLAPPPNQDQTEKEIEEMLKIQANRSEEAIIYAFDDQDLYNVFRFSTILGKDFKKENLPETDMFFYKVVNNAKNIFEPSKEIWKRPRPSTFDNRINPCLLVPYTASYPSGHSTVGNLIAIILADMLPEKKVEIFNRGWEFAMNRVIGGVHYPSDIEAGKIVAALIANEMFKNNEFKKDYKIVKSEIRTKLGYNN